MNLVGRIKCTFNSKQSIESYYASLSKTQLERRKKNLANTYLITSLTWLTSLFTILIAADMDGVLLILYSGAVFATLLATLQDYRKRLGILKRLLESEQ